MLRFFAVSSASERFDAGTPPLSRMNAASAASSVWIAVVSACYLPGAPFAMSSFAISVCTGFFFCAGPTASINGVNP